MNSLNDQNEPLKKIGNFIAKHLNLFENILAIITIAAVLLKMFTALKTGFVITLSLTTLATLYFFRAYAVHDDEHAGGMEVFIDKLASFAGSVAIIGIMFRLEHWPGYEIMLQLGGITLLIVLAAIAILKSKKPQLKIFNRRLVIRIIVLLFLAAALYSTPKETLRKMRVDKEVPVEIIK